MNSTTPPLITASTTRNTENDLEQLLTLEEAGRIIRTTHWTMRHYVKEGMIRSVRVGRRLMIEPSEMRSFIERGRG